MYKVTYGLRGEQFPHVKLFDEREAAGELVALWDGMDDWFVTLEEVGPPPRGRGPGMVIRLKSGELIYQDQKLACAITEGEAEEILQRFRTSYAEERDFTAQRWRQIWFPLIAQKWVDR